MFAEQRTRIRQQSLQLEETLYFETCESPKIRWTTTKVEELGYPAANVQQAKNAAPRHCQSQLVVSDKNAKHSESFGEGEFIKECRVDVARIICPEKKKILGE
jgi:hypothetical protein